MSKNEKQQAAETEAPKERTHIPAPEKENNAPVDKTAFELEQLRQRFGPYRPPTEETIPKFKAIQEAALRFAELIFELCPNSQQRSSALTLLEQAKMSANAAIAIHTPRTTAPKGAQA